MGRVACWSLVSKKLRESFKGAERDFKGLGRLVMGALLGRTCQASKMAEALGCIQSSATGHCIEFQCCWLAR